MKGRRYDVILEKGCRPGVDPGQVKANLAKLFNLRSGRIDILFEKLPAVIKKELDQASAQKYRKAIENAGAVCSIRPLSSAPVVMRKFQEQESSPGERKILRLSACPASIYYSPLTVPFISGNPAGMDFNRRDMEPISCSDIRLISFFVEKQGNTSLRRMLFFVRGFRRPYLVTASKIRYRQFVDEDTMTVFESARRFILFFLARNPDIFVDENTDAFLHGKRPFEVGRPLLDYVTALGKAVDSDGVCQDLPETAQEGAKPLSGAKTGKAAGLPGQNAVPNINMPGAGHPVHDTVNISGPMVSGPSGQLEKPATSIPAAGQKEIKGRPDIEFTSFSWSELFSISFFAGIYVLFVVGLWKAPVMLYDFLSSHVRINGKTLHFHDRFIWLRILLYGLPWMLIAACSVALDLSGYHRGFWQDVLLWLFVPAFIFSIVACPIVALQSILTHTYPRDGEPPFRPLYEGNGINDMVRYICSHPGDALGIIFAGLLIQSLLLAPCGFALVAKITLGRLRVNGYRYTFEIPWLRTVLWCLWGYLSLFLGLFRYCSILYEEIMPSGKWEKVA